MNCFFAADGGGGLSNNFGVFFDDGCSSDKQTGRLAKSIELSICKRLCVGGVVVYHGDSGVDVAGVDEEADVG